MDMSSNKNIIWESKTAQQFAEALFAIDNIKVLQNFLSDIMTEKEIAEICSRLEAARMLQEGNKYTDIIAKTKLSSRTVARISDWMKNGHNGYSVVLSQIHKHHSHTPPA